MKKRNHNVPNKFCGLFLLAKKRCGGCKNLRVKKFPWTKKIDSMPDFLDKQAVQMLANNKYK